MTSKKRFKQKIFAVSKLKPINKVILGSYSFVKPFAPRFIKKIYSKFPVNGITKAQLVDSKQFIMKSDGSDTIANKIYWNGIDSYEHITISIFPRLLRQANTFFDIGANTGIYTLIAASMNRRIEVHAFEPVDVIYRILEENIKINELNNVRLNELALCEFNGESQFNLQSVNDPIIPLGSSLRNDMGDKNNMRIIKVQTCTLDRYVEENNISGIDIMKVDTEGTEDKVFEGGSNSLQRFRPVILCEVLSNLIEEKLHNIFDKLDYEYYYVNEEKLERCKTIVGDPNIVSNYLFVPAEKAKVLLGDLQISEIDKKEFKKL